MKKILIVASIACACASAFNAYADAETPPRYKNWFTGINQTGDPRDVSVSSDLVPENGSWTTLGTGTKTWNTTSGFEYDLDSAQTVVFTAEAAAAPETNTITRVELTSYFTPVVCAAYADLAVPLSGDFAFAAVAKTNADQTAEFSYRVWTGGDSWSALDGVAPNYEEDIPVTLIASFDYRDDTAKKVDFSIVTNGVTNVFETVPLTSTVGEGVGGLTCSGSGNVIALNGEVAEAIAEMGGKKYISLEEANAAAGDGDVIDVLAETDESITLADGATISNANGKVTGTIAAGENSTVTIDLNAVDIGNGANGTYTVPIKTGGSGIIVVAQPLANKEIADGTTDIVAGSSITVTIHTKTELLAAMRPDADNKDKAFVVDNTTNSPLRVFLEKHSAAYRATDASTATIEDELQSVPTDSNGLELWQDYVLGIEPTTDVGPVSRVVGDPSTTEIRLEVPSLDSNAFSGDYTVTYAIYKEGVGEPVDTASTPGELKIPVSNGSTGKYTVKAILVPAP